MFGNNHTLFGIIKQEKIKNEDDVINHLKGFKKQKEENPNTDFVKESVNEDIDILKPKEDYKKKINNNNINIPDAKYYKYQQQRRRIKDFIKKYDTRGYTYTT